LYTYIYIIIIYIFFQLFGLSSRACGRPNGGVHATTCGDDGYKESRGEEGARRRRHRRRRERQTDSCLHRPSPSPRHIPPDRHISDREFI